MALATARTHERSRQRKRQRHDGGEDNGVGWRAMAWMDRREEPRNLAALGECEEHSRPAQHRAHDVAGHGNDRARAHEHRPGGPHEQQGSVGKRRCSCGQIGQRPGRHDLCQRHDRGDQDDRGNERKWKVPAGVGRLSGGHADDVIATKCEDQQQRAG